VFAQWSRVTDRQTDWKTGLTDRENWQSLETLIAIVCIWCIRCSLKTIVFSLIKAGPQIWAGWQVVNDTRFQTPNVCRLHHLIIPNTVLWISTCFVCYSWASFLIFYGRTSRGNIQMLLKYAYAGVCRVIRAPWRNQWWPLRPSNSITSYGTVRRINRIH